MTQQILRRQAPSLPRLVSAFMIAPAAAMTPFAVLVLTSVGPPTDAWSEVAVLLGIGWAVGLAIGVPAYFRLRRTIDLHLGTAVLTGMAIVVFLAAAIGVLLALASGQPAALLFTPLWTGFLGVLLSPIGAIGGGVFWTITGSAPAIQRGDPVTELAKTFA